jgi:hypothetical protein
MAHSLYGLLGSIGQSDLADMAWVIYADALASSGALQALEEAIEAGMTTATLWQPERKSGANYQHLQTFTYTRNVAV